MKYDTNKGFYLVALLLIFAIANGWGMFWKVAVSFASILELMAIASKIINLKK